MRVIIVGYGNQGHKRINALGPDDELVAIVEPDFSKLDTDIVRFHNAHAYKTVAALIDNENNYDAAIICTPTNEQKENIVRRLLMAGKHILVEKPLWPISDTGLWEIQDYARQHGLVCYTAYNHRYEPAIQRLHSELQSVGEWSIGKIYETSMFYGNGTVKNVIGSWRERVPLGVISEVGSHLFDLITYLPLEGENKVLAWDFFIANHEAKCLDHALVVRDNIYLEMSFLSWKNTFTIDIYGENGSLHVNGLTKWGESTFTQRQRVLPSGVPIEQSISFRQPDRTWEIEWQVFKAKASGLPPKSQEITDLSSDIWMAEIFNRLLREVNCGVEKCA